MGENGIRADMELPADALEKGTLLDAPLRGQVELRMRQLGLLTAIVPALRETEGTISAHFLISGTLGAPRLSGKAILDTKGPELLMAGIKIDRTFFEVAADGSNLLSMDGYLQQGGQRIELSGSLLLSSSKGWPVRMKMAGSRFKILDIPDASIYMSPDLSLAYARPDGLKVRGTIGIPEANIRPRQLPPEVKRPSDDVIIVSSRNPEGGKRGGPVDAKVTIALGEQIHFNGFGLDCYITGRLTISALPEKGAHGPRGTQDKEGGVPLLWP
jgi:translocation and assembly module TamB